MRESHLLVVPAAGLGTRIKRMEPTLPKEMLVVDGKPAIQYAIEEGVAAGITKAAVVISPKKEIIRRYFEDLSFARTLFPDGAKDLPQIHSKCQIIFLTQSMPLGEANAIGLASACGSDGPVSVIYPDNIYFPSPGALESLLKTYEKFDRDTIGLMSMTAEKVSGSSDSGKVDLSPLKGQQGVFRVLKRYPKKAGDFVLRFQGELRTCGIYVVGPHLFEYIDRAARSFRGEALTDGQVFDLIVSDRDLLGSKLPGEVFDLGTPRGYKSCVRALAL